jgi:hypothetical protein
MGKIAEFVDSRVEAQSYFPEDMEERKVTVRLISPVVDDLDFVAAKLGYTRSGVAAELLAVAISEARKAVETHPLLVPDGGVSVETIARIADAEEESEETGADPLALLISGSPKSSKRTKS